ncbi:hypothetical protein FHR72_003275 [Mycolicibacterium iranicum]|uniref:Uncharacterized protein n=1 Tax=Mycolicibacterium iranicum TaxID=912594 RepID=A0A839QBF5_MYCIR|nr:hypothetical protein [Mycolicibacterium iranicum]
MSSPVEPMVTETDGEDPAGGVATQQPVVVYNCSRIGRVANPPGFSFTDWFRPSRRRRLS